MTAVTWVRGVICLMSVACIGVAAGCAGASTSTESSVTVLSEPAPPGSESQLPPATSPVNPPSSGTPLPPNFDAFQNACIPLGIVGDKMHQLARPMALGTPEDAWRQAQVIPWMIDSVLATRLEDFGDPRVVDAQGRLVNFADSLARLRKAAKQFANSPSAANYASWEEAWFMANDSATFLTFQCLY